MNWELLIKSVVAIGVIFTISRVIFDFHFGKKANLREEYRFAKEFLDETDKSDLHPFTIGKGYQAIAGTTAVKAQEIEYLLSLENPIQSLRDFVFSKQLFERAEGNGEFELKFKKKYMSKLSRLLWMWFYRGVYFVLSFAALSPLLLAKPFGISSGDMIIQLIFTLPFFGLYAGVSLNAYGKFSRAEHLYNNQRRHTSQVVW
ncbi:hypothetical protein JL49_15740 [Pseudoalteromonas luteoviolacea]|nr:hypothetical protein JL49_15740 [Pseudoalteromonas luteoviolacea]